MRDRDETGPRPRWWRSLRVRLAALGFLAIYVPVLVLAGVSTVTETTVNVRGVEVTEGASTSQSPWIVWTIVALGPVAALAAWWLAGRAVRPIDHVRRVAEDIEASDLGRRIALDHGPTEVVALAASFDAMLDRLEHAADLQRRLIEEASHELRTPLAVLATNADVLLADQEAGRETIREGLQRSKAAAVRMTGTIDGLLVDARGRARTLDRRAADLMATVRAVVDEASVLAGPRQVRVTVTGPATVELSFDEPTVLRAVSNVVDNAVRHAPVGGEVRVAVAVGDSDVHVTIADEGPGVPAEQQAQLFERFWRGRADTGGAGLGLPIARQVARAHGGDLTMRSGPSGRGCLFDFVLRRTAR